MSDFVLRGGELVFPDKKPAKRDILVQGGRIKALLEPGATVPRGTPEQAAAGLHVFPGLIDAHVHFGMGEKITEYDRDCVCRAGLLTTVPAPSTRGLLRFPAQLSTRSRAHRDSFPSARQQNAHQGRRYLIVYGVTPSSTHELQGDEGATWGGRPVTDSSTNLRASRRVDRPTKLHTETSDRQPRAHRVQRGL